MNSSHGPYAPSPIDLSGIELPESLLDLTEAIAENTHEVWSRNRLAEGWTYGPVRDDANLRHPGLLPYSELSESENVSVTDSVFGGCRMANVKASCGCTTPSYTQKPVMPGKTGEIGVRYNTNNPGGFTKTVTVTSNAVNEPRVVVKIKGNVVNPN